MGLAFCIKFVRTEDGEDNTGNNEVIARELARQIGGDDVQYLTATAKQFGGADEQFVKEVERCHLDADKIHVKEQEMGDE